VLGPSAAGSPTVSRFFEDFQYPRNGHQRSACWLGVRPWFHRIEVGFNLGQPVTFVLPYFFAAIGLTPDIKTCDLQAAEPLLVWWRSTILYIDSSEPDRGVGCQACWVSNPLIGLLGIGFDCWGHGTAIAWHRGSPQPWRQQCLEIRHRLVPPSVWCWPPLNGGGPNARLCIRRQQASTAFWPPGNPAGVDRRRASSISYFSRCARCSGFEREPGPGRGAPMKPLQSRPQSPLCRPRDCSQLVCSTS